MSNASTPYTAINASRPSTSLSVAATVAPSPYSSPSELDLWGAPIFPDVNYSSPLVEDDDASAASLLQALAQQFHRLQNYDRRAARKGQGDLTFERLLDSALDAKPGDNNNEGFRLHVGIDTEFLQDVDQIIPGGLRSLSYTAADVGPPDNEAEASIPGLEARSGVASIPRVSQRVGDI